jgi:hypothetical protein
MPVEEKPFNFPGMLSPADLWKLAIICVGLLAMSIMGLVFLVEHFMR